MPADAASFLLINVHSWISIRFSASPVLASGTWLVGRSQATAQ
jgi:hypothetical protein